MISRTCPNSSMRRFYAAGVALALGLSACGGDDGTADDFRPVATARPRATAPRPASRSATPPAGQDWRIAPADGQVTISMSEFNRIREGMAWDDVWRLVGGRGELISSSEVAGYRTEMYMWEADARCGDSGGNANVMVQNDAVIAKSQFGLC